MLRNNTQPPGVVLLELQPVAGEAERATREARSGCCAGCTPGATQMSHTQGMLPLICIGTPS